MLGMLLFWVLLIAGIVVGTHWLLSRRKESGPSESPLEILRERYARGEIDKEEFEARKRDLT